MLMKTLAGLISISTLAVAAASSPAFAQTAKAGSLANVKPVMASAAACTSGLMELAPVSFDGNGRAEAWVVVYRINGEIVAAERASPSEIEQLNRSPCRADTYRGQQPAG